jgi:hypothetical protein
MGYEVHFVAESLEGFLKDPSGGTDVLRQVVLRDR